MFVSNGNTWDANVACKCLGKCALQPFEDLNLIQTCRYSAQDEARMEYLISNEDIIPLGGPV